LRFVLCAEGGHLALTFKEANLAERRSFLKNAIYTSATIANAGIIPLLGEAHSKRILVLGGTFFPGLAFVEAALADGPTVTVFNRGVTNPELFPFVEKLRGFRCANLDDQNLRFDLDHGDLSKVADPAGRATFFCGHNFEGAILPKLLTVDGVCHDHVSRMNCRINLGKKIQDPIAVPSAMIAIIIAGPRICRSERHGDRVQLMSAAMLPIHVSSA
jgi:hypothetical protein